MDDHECKQDWDWSYDISTGDMAKKIFAGIDPEDGKFFVAKKSVFNVNPKLYKSASEVDADVSGALNSKFKIALAEFSKLGIKDVLQGDLMFTDDVESETIDGTKYFLDEQEKKYNNLIIVHIDNHVKHAIGKKFALTLGVKTAKHEHLLLTDADCLPNSSNWAKQMSSNFNNSEIVLGFGGYQKRKGLLNKIIRFDTFNVAKQYLSYALAGFTYMGVGRNMAYKKSLFFKNKGFAKHLHIPSGDDDLFIQEVANKDNVSVEIVADAHTTSTVIERWKDWSYQKRRHITTAPLYKTKFKILLAVYPYAQFFF